MKTRNLLATVMVVSMLLAAALPARAIPFVGFTLTEMANTLGAGSSFSTPTMNDNGTIAVVARLDNGHVQVQTYDVPKTPTIIAENTTSLTFASGFKFEPRINNNGTVVFLAEDNLNKESLVASTGGVFTTIVETGSIIEGRTVEFVDPDVDGDFDLADNGDVLFIAEVIGHDVGMFQRNVAGGDLTNRVAPVDASDFNLNSPANNASGNVAVFAEFLSGSTRTRQQVLSSFGTLMDTNSSEFGLTLSNLESQNPVDMSNANGVAFMAKLENGEEGIFKVIGGAQSTVVDTSGPFNRLFSPSINNAGNVTFQARLDVGGGEGIYTGPNPLLNEVIAVGDSLGVRNGVTRTVTNIRFGNDGRNNTLGGLTFVVGDQLGDQYLYRSSSTINTEILDNLAMAQLTTASGPMSKMTQPVTPGAVPGLTELSFDYRFLTPGGELAVLLNNIEVGRVFAPDQAMDELEKKILLLDLPNLFGGGDSFIPGELLLTLSLEGGPGQTVQVDNVSFLNLINGDFGTGDLTGWSFFAGRGTGAALVTNGLDLVFDPAQTTPGGAIPEPVTATLGMLSLSALGMAMSRRRCKH